MSIILQKYVDSEIFTLRSDEDFAKLKEAATNLSKSELKKKVKLPAYILTAFDPNISSDEPTLEKTKELVIKQSPTVLSQSKDTPRTILRAVILEALYTRAMNDMDYARILWLTASSFIAHYTSDNEKNILYTILQEIGEIVEKDATEKWSELNTVEVLRFNETSLSIEKINNIDSAIKTFKSNFTNSIQYDNSNVHHAQYVNQSVISFVASLKENGAKEIADLVKKSFDSYKNMFDNISNSLIEFMSEIEPYLHDIGNQLINSVTAVNNRSELLWWKESLYSQTIKSSYRSLDSTTISVVMAFDLHFIVDQVYPVSIDFFLRETSYKLIPIDQDTISLESFILLFKQEFLANYLRNSSIKPEHSDNRTTLLGYLVSTANGQVKELKIKEQLGIDPNTKFSLHDLAVWLFHDLQAYKIMLN